MVTISDVAKKAGVGISTVSYVLNKTGLNKVGLKTQERIRAAAAELHYTPNIAGKALKKGVTYTVGVEGREFKSRRVHHLIFTSKCFLVRYL